MSRFSSPWLISAVAVPLAVAALVYADPGPGAATDDPEGEAVDQELRAHLAATTARIAYKDALTDRLIAGQITLEEATAEFLRLNRDAPFLDVIRANYPGSSDEEKNARTVLEYVRGRQLPADQRARVLGRLKEDFRRRFGTSPDPVIPRQPDDL